MVELFGRIKDMIFFSKRTINFFRQQNYIKAYSNSKRVLCDLQECLAIFPEEIYGEIYQNFLLAIRIILEAMETGDEIILADIYQLEILPLLHQILNALCGESENLLEDYWEGIQGTNWEKNQKILEKRYPELNNKLIECKNKIPDDYMVSLTRNGEILLEIATEDNGIVRMNSICDPIQEAVIYAENYKDAEEYLVVGWGMGYHIWALLEQPVCKKVLVLENDIYPLIISFMYHDWTEILEDERLSVIYCQDNVEYFKYWNQALDVLKICLWYPSVRAMRNDFAKGKLEEAKITLSSIENMALTLINNFERNMEVKDEEVSFLRKNFAGKRVLLIAAGPSLDKNMEQLKQSKRSGYILVCVGRVAIKLIKAGIKPDYIVILDAQPETRYQLNGIEECGVPLIYISTVAFQAVKAYKGKRYIAFQEGFDKAEKYAKGQGYLLYQQGGSVTTFALDVLIQLGCSSIICIGLDLGYPGEETHTTGVGGDTLVDKRCLYPVEGIESEYVYTSRPLDMYRQWIEKRISTVKKTELINASKGARIHGMKEMELGELL